MSNYILPVLVLGIVCYGLYKKVDLYDAFIDGSKEGFKIAYTVFPNLLAMIVSVNILVSSGIIDWVIQLVIPFVKIPVEIVSLSIMRPISGNGALALLNTIYTKYGVDHFYSLLGSTIQGSTDTTLYVIALYYGSIGIKNIRYALKASLIADAVGIAASVLICYILFS